VQGAECPASTLRSYKKLFHLLLADRGDDHLIEVVSEELSRFRANRVAPPRRKGRKEHAITPNTLRKELKILRSLFNFCVRQKWIMTAHSVELRLPERAGGPERKPAVIAAASGIWWRRVSSSSRRLGSSTLNRLNAQYASAGRAQGLRT
jgi:site-specific recombinase XerD